MALEQLNVGHTLELRTRVGALTELRTEEVAFRRDGKNLAQAVPDLLKGEFDALLLVVSSTTPHADFRVEISTNMTERISARVGSKVTYIGNFKAGTSMEKVLLRPSDFIAMDRTGAHHPEAGPLKFSSHEGDSDSRITHLGLSVYKDGHHLEHGPIHPIPFELKIHSNPEIGPVIPLREMLNPARTISIQGHSYPLFRLFVPNNLSGIGTTEDGMTTHVFHKALSNLADPGIQRWAAQVAADRGWLEHELRRIHFEIGAELNGKIGLVDILTNHIRRGSMPVEAGDFGRFHGAYSHHAQLVAMTHDMSSEEVGVLINLLRSGIAGRHTGDWLKWTPIFDSYDPRDPTSPQFWRDLIEEHRH